MKFHQKSVEVSYKSDQTDLTRRFVAPVQKFRIHLDEKTKNPRPVLSIDVTNGGLGVSSSNDGSLLIWLTENGQVRVRHFSFIKHQLNLKFFKINFSLIEKFAWSYWGCKCL